MASASVVDRRSVQLNRIERSLWCQQPGRRRLPLLLRTLCPGDERAVAVMSGLVGFSATTGMCGLHRASRDVISFFLALVKSVRFC